MLPSNYLPHRFRLEMESIGNHLSGVLGIYGLTAPITRPGTSLLERWRCPRISRKLWPPSLLTV